MKKTFLGITLIVSTNILIAQQIDNIRTSWVANTNGNPDTHIMHTVDNMYVRPDGTVYASCIWDEGGFNVSIFKNGAFIMAPKESGTGSWGRNSNGVVYADNNYIYHSMNQHGCDGGYAGLNTNGLPLYPSPCLGGSKPLWQCIRRYNQTDGYGAPFATGYGYDGSMLIVNINGEGPNGITSIGNELFVSDPTGDTIKVYNKTTLAPTPIRKFHIARAGLLAADEQGYIWMLQKHNSTIPASIIRINASNGAIMSQQITFPSTVIPSSFSVYKNRILVTDIGVAQQVRIYTNITVSPNFSGTFGENGGIYSGNSGEVAPLKFNKPMGVGEDAAGNIYVGNTSNYLGGASVESYNSSGQQNWKLEGLAFTAVADFDKQTDQDVYLVDKRLSMDMTKTAPGTEWTYKANTFNPFKYPHDSRNFGYYTSPLIRTIQNKKFLFNTDMYGGKLAVYRFNSATNGEIAIPNAYFTGGDWDNRYQWGTTFPLNKEWLWQDKNGDGTIQQIEYDQANVDNYYVMTWWADENGGVWKGLRENGIRYFPAQGLDANGAIQYSYASSTKYPFPKGINGVKRILYKANENELFLGGFNDELPDTNDTWYAIGTVINKYSNWTGGNKNPDWSIVLPFKRRGNDASNIYVAKTFTVEGDYVFVILEKEGIINVYSRENGSFIGEIRPGSSVNNKSGWADINIAITATKRTNGEYIILAEENGYGKVLMYRWCPNGNCKEVNTSFNEISSAKNKLEIYPNPATDKLYLNNLPSQSTISISDMAGKILINVNAQDTSETIDISSLEAGIYLVKVGEVTKKINVQ